MKGVTRKIVEIKSPGNPSFERAVLYLRPDFPKRSQRKTYDLAEEYLGEIAEPPCDAEKKNLRTAVAVLSLSLAVALAALGCLLILYTKM